MGFLVKNDDVDQTRKLCDELNFIENHQVCPILEQEVLLYKLSTFIKLRILR